MKKIDLVLRKKEEGVYYFSNQKTDSENETFKTKKEGVIILMKYVSRKIVTFCKAIELIDEIASILNLPVGDKAENSQLIEDMATLAYILSVKINLEKVSVSETEENLPKLKMCENCNEHGKLIGENFISVELFDKKSANEAVEELFGTGKINKDQKGKLLNEIDKSPIPEKSSIVDPEMN